MLSHLSIQNYALIRQLDIDFINGFTVITGETGAGKSILLGALNLMLGKRADTQLLLDKSKKCIVEGTFSISKYNLQDFFESNELDYEDHALLRREIHNNGKSRAFINDTPVNLQLLKDLGERLIDIHSQHQTITLHDADFQLAVIDSFAGNTEKVKKFRGLYGDYMKLKKELDHMITQENKSKSEKDYFEFLFSELESAKLIPGEQEQLEKELEVLNHAEEIKSRLYHSSQVLGSNEINILKQLSDIRTNLNQISKYSNELGEISNRIETNFIELTDISTAIEKNAESVSYHPERVNEIKERLDMIYHLQNKHRVNSVSELTSVKDDIVLKLKTISSLEEKIRKLTIEIKKAEETVLTAATGVSLIRRKNFKDIEKSIGSTLTDLGMPYARFGIQHKLLEIPGKDGLDAVKFLFNANKGGELQELSKVASGGELSRLMLAIKSLISQKNLLPTIVFDEIDIGVSGKIADRVGTILGHLSGSIQVIAITHLPQIAGKGNAHYYVFKNTDINSTKTEIKILNPDERILEIAKMLSGQDITPSSLETAKHLLK
jgi:DNA repair protein RecN (Recombination protein N)